MKSLILTIISLIPLFSFTQSPTIQWQKCFGGTGNDSAVCIKQTLDGGFIIAATTFSFNGDITHNHGQSDVLIIKLDSLGNKLWSKTYGSTDYEYATSIELSDDSSFIVAATNGDAFIYKIDKQGNLKWQKSFGGSNYDILSCIKKLNNGDFMLIGTTRSSDGDLSGISNAKSQSPFIWRLKIDSVGNMKWQNAYHASYPVHSGGDFGFGDKVINNLYDNGYCYTTGFWTHSNTNEFGYLTVFNIDTFNNKKWQFDLQFTHQPQLHQENMNLFADSNFLLATTKTKPSPPWPGPVTFDIYKLNHKTGLPIWNKSYTPDSTALPTFRLRSILTSSNIDANNNNIMIGGNIMATKYSSCNTVVNCETFNHDTSGLTYDFWLLSLDSSGDFISQKCYGGSKDDYLVDLHSIPNNQYIAVGNTYSNDGDVSGNHGSSDIWVVKFSTLALPTQFISFQIKKQHTSNYMLHWQTANEINVSHFSVQLSTNGKDFINIGEVKAQGEGSKKYSFIDEQNNDYLQPTTLYYRIVAVDFNEHLTYSNVKKVLVNTNKQVAIYPNPSKGYINVECKVGIKEIKLLNTLGQQVVIKYISDDNNTQNLSLNIQHLQKGLYIMQVTTAKGEVLNEKLVVEK